MRKMKLYDFYGGCNDNHGDDDDDVDDNDDFNDDDDDDVLEFGCT